MREKLPPSGQYIVGTTRFDLYDEHRPESNFPQGRLIPLQVYFPLNTGQHKTYKKDLESRGSRNFPLLESICFSKPAGIHEILPGEHPLVILNHGNYVHMTDYTFLTEDLASHGYVVISICHQLNTDVKPPSFWEGRSYSKHGQIIDNLLYVFQWIQKNLKDIFQNKLKLNKIALIGHSMGGNALLMLANRISSMFRASEATLLPYHLEQTPTECIICIDGEFPPVHKTNIPIFYLLSEERLEHRKTKGTENYLIKEKYNFKHYKGSRHISFMDHGLVLSKIPGTDEKYFNGTNEELLEFYAMVRGDIRNFFISIGIK